MEISFRVPPIFPSISSGTVPGHASSHFPQPVHDSSSTYLARGISLILKPSSLGLTFRTSVLVRISMLGWVFTSYILGASMHMELSLIHISEPTRRTPISYAVFCLKKKKKQNR